MTSPIDRQPEVAAERLREMAFTASHFADDDPVLGGNADQPGNMCFTAGELRAALALALRAFPLPDAAGEVEPVDTADQWRDLALQFDGHRIEALSMLKYAVRSIEEYAAVRDILREPLTAIKTFLAKPPLNGAASASALATAQRQRDDALEALKLARDFAESELAQRGIKDADHPDHRRAGWIIDQIDRALIAKEQTHE